MEQSWQIPNPLSPVNTFLFRFFFGCTLIALGISAPAQETELRGELERAYQNWRRAVIAKDARGWATSITMYRQVVTRNLMVSQRQPFPQAVFEVPLDPPDIASLKLLEAQAVGDTAHLLYFGKVNLGGEPADIPDNVLMLKFFREKGLWKFDSSKVLRLTEEPELKKQLQSGGTPEFLDYPDFTPPGTPPAVPPLCDKPENMAGCTLQSFGYSTRMKLNGFSYGTMEDRGDKLFVIGGLKNGLNELTLEVKPTDIPKGEERLLQVDLFVSTGQPGKPSVRVYHYESKDPTLTGVIKLPVVIDAEILVKGR